MTTDSRITALAQRIRDEINAMKVEYRSGVTPSPIPRTMMQYVRTGGYVGFAGATTTGMVMGSQYYRPVRVGLGGTVTSVKMNCTVAAASSTVAIGLYAHDATAGLPAAQVANFGTIDTTTTGVKALTISQALSNDTVYWLSCLALGGGPTMNATDVEDPLVSRNSNANGVDACYADWASPVTSLRAPADARPAAGNISKMPSIILGA